MLDQKVNKEQIQVNNILNNLIYNFESELMVAND